MVQQTRPQLMTLYSIVLVCMLLLVFPALFTMSLVFFKLPLVLFRHIFPEELHNLIGAQLTKIQVTYGETNLYTPYDTHNHAKPRPEYYWHIASYYR